MRACAALATSSVLYALAAARGGTTAAPDGVPRPFAARDTARRLGSRSEALAISAVLGVLMLQ